jgi:hypothetical protein
MIVFSDVCDCALFIQGFNWESWKQNGGWYSLLMGKVDDIAAAGITHVWLPPPSHSVAEQGAALSALSHNIGSPAVCQALTCVCTSECRIHAGATL